MNRRSFPSLNAKKDFFGLSEIPFLKQRWKICFRSLRWLLRFLEYTSIIQLTIPMVDNEKPVQQKLRKMHPNLEN